MLDVIIVGGGPAGLSAALVLARCMRKVVVFDNGRQRNLKAGSMHAYLSRDGIAPAEFLDICRKELQAYPVETIMKTVRYASALDYGFRVTDEDGKDYYCRKLLLATGLTDNIPKLEGLEPLYGKSVYHCPYCDGWESRDKKLVAYGKGLAGMSIAQALKNWSSHVVLCTDGPSKLKLNDIEKLEARGIKVHTNKIMRLNGENGQLSQVCFQDGTMMDADVLFFSTGYEQKCILAYQLGCRFSTKKKEVMVNRHQESNIKGIYVCGDAAYDMKFVIIAAAEGAKAAIAINIALMEEGFYRTMVTQP